MSSDEGVATVLAFLNGETYRTEACGKHPQGHKKEVGDDPYGDLLYIQKVLEESWEPLEDPAPPHEWCG